MKILAKAGREEVALVYIAEMGKGKRIEFVESLQPPLTRDEKWVLLVSTLFGCPVGCKMCDAGGVYRGRLSREEIFAQIDAMVLRRFPDGHVPSRQFKIQFARMGEPAFNPAVNEVLEELPVRYHAPGLLPSVSTIAPCGCESFFERLLEIKRRLYRNGAFQLQFSIHTTDLDQRDQLMPVKKWDFRAIADYGREFYFPGDRKITLNFALTEGMPVDRVELLKYFSPELFLIKITPLNPTYRALEHGLASALDWQLGCRYQSLVDELQASGYQVIVSIGELEENQIGSNCGQYLRRHLEGKSTIQGGYTYPVLESS